MIMDFFDNELIGQKIVLKPITKHGKDRVHQFGKEWIIDGVSDTVMFSSERGPFVRLKSLCKKDTRWVRMKNDKNFEIIF